MTDRIFKCPICGQTLFTSERTLRCSDGHVFDISSMGYVNLLRPGKMRNRNSGDDHGMVTARTRFLSSGYYQPNRDTIIELAKKYLPCNSIIVDAGCGEGYYTNGLAEAIGDSVVIGIDASKHACGAAARAAKRLGVANRTAYATASLTDAPIPDKSVDLILSFFSPCDYGEFCRILKDGGKVLIGSAGKRHLYELKEVLYGVGNVRDNEPVLHGERAEGTGLYHAFCKTLYYKTKVIGQEDINALYSMTPYFWRTPRSGAEALARLDELTVTVEVDFTVLSL